ncbi:hypothetical protein J2Z47_000574 [Cohnella thailandensis]|nr:hypothetical protein [Cohnella thailandensis]
MSHFWFNTIWYLLLGVTTVIQVVYTLYLSENRCRTFAFYLTLVGLPLYFETFILIFLDAYVYYPMIIRSPSLDPFNDVLVGNLFSQTAVAASALLLAVRQKPFSWNVVAAFLYCVVEEFFKALGIYSQHWWKTWMTFIGLLLMFVITKWMYSRLVQGLRTIYCYGYIIFGMFPVCTVLFLWGVLDLSGLMRFKATLLSNPKISRYGLYLVFFTISYPIMVWGYFRQHWIWKAAVFTVVGAIIYLGYVCHLLIFREGWFIPISILMILWIYVSVWILDSLYREQF